jgi:thiol-disulfide isomerase/thioredoxin
MASNMLKSVLGMHPLQKIFVLLAIATIFCSVFTDCILCKKWPLTFDANVKNPFEGFDTGKKLVLYKADFCSHCKAMKGEWEKLKTMYQGSSTQVETMDSEKDADAVQAANVQAFPTIMLYVNDKTMTYSGDRTADAIKSWADAQS